MKCNCCGQKMDHTTCVHCYWRHSCAACGMILSCSCGRNTEHSCTMIPASSGVVTSGEPWRIM